MCFFTQRHNLGEMGMVDMSIDTKQSLEDGFDNLLEILWKWYAYFGWEDCFIIQLVLHPRHEIINIFWCRHLNGFLNSCAISPMILVLGASRHDGALLWCAELGYGPIEHVDLVEKVHRVHSKPLIQIFTFWQGNCQTQIATTKGRLGILLKLILLCALLYVLLGFECLTLLPVQ